MLWNIFTRLFGRQFRSTDVKLVRLHHVARCWTLQKTTTSWSPEKTSLPGEVFARLACPPTGCTTAFGLCLSGRRSTERRALGRPWLLIQVLFGQELEQGSNTVPCSVVRNGHGRCKTYEGREGLWRSVKGRGSLQRPPCLRRHFTAASERIRRSTGTPHLCSG